MSSICTRNQVARAKSDREGRRWELRGGAEERREPMERNGDGADERPLRIGQIEAIAERRRDDDRNLRTRALAAVRLTAIRILVLFAGAGAAVMGDVLDALIRVARRVARTGRLDLERRRIFA